MPNPTLAQVKKAVPFGAFKGTPLGEWKRVGGVEFVRWAQAKHAYLTPEAVHEAISKPCDNGYCANGKVPCYDPHCADHPCPTCNGTGSAAPELWELVNG